MRILRSSSCKEWKINFKLCEGHFHNSALVGRSLLLLMICHQKLFALQVDLPWFECAPAFITMKFIASSSSRKLPIRRVAADVRKVQRSELSSESWLRYLWHWIPPTLLENLFCMISSASATNNDFACQIKKPGACYLLAIVEFTNGFAAIHKIFRVLIELQSTTFSTEVAENLRVRRKFSSLSANKNVWKVFAAFPLSLASRRRRRRFKGETLNELIN